MAIDNSQSQESDLDRTDRLPILEGVTIDDDVEDDAVRLDFPAQEPSAIGAAGQAPHSPSPHGPASHGTAPYAPAPDFARPGMDLPSLAESVRSVEERIARHSADYEALNRLYEKARDAQLAAGTRADALASELSVLQSVLAVEQHRSREMSRAASEGSAAAEASRTRAEEFSREAERYQSEARTLRDALAARDGTIAQVLHSLGERDAQLFALQREHAQIVPVLEARSRATAQLEVDLQAARSNAETLSLELDKSRVTVTSLTDKLARGESDLATVRRDLSTARAQAASYLELLRSRDWRGGFNQNLFREWDDKVDAASSGHGALRAECERLTETVALLGAKLAEHEATISKLHMAGSAEAAARASTSRALDEALSDRAELHSRIERLEADCKRLQGELAARGDELVARGDELVARGDELNASQVRHGELTAQLEQLRAEAISHEEELTVLMAHLNEARRPVQSIQADITRLNEELASKSTGIDQLTEENRTLRATLERTRGALEGRDLLIRRLERSATNNANVLGRLQTSIERLGSGSSPPAPPAPPAPPPAGELLAELIKIEGDTRTAYPVGRRTRIGRAPGCELQIDSQSVSRHHAMLLKGMREVIIEDLNSTNGVLINGHKVVRHVLCDGDLITIGETQFQCRLKPASRATEEAAGGNANVPVPPGASEPAQAAVGSDPGFSEPPRDADPLIGE
jgi:predicted  nucleic acid-binding Zn-ribbon protein